MKLLVLPSLCLILIFQSVQTAKILGIFPFPGKSHYTMFERAMIALAERGHEVDVYTHFTTKEQIPRYKQISLLGTLPIATNNFTAELAEYSFTDMLKLMTVWSGTELCETMFETKQMRDLKVTPLKYDLVVTELFSADCMLGWGYRFGVPVVGMTSSYHLPWTGDMFGMPDNPSYIPTYFAFDGPPTGFYQRFLNTVQYVMAKWYHSTSRASQNEIAKKFFGNDLPDLRQLSYNISLCLVNAHHSTNGARPLPPNVIEVAGMHIQKPAPLNSHFNDLLKTDTKGIIYLTMGSVMQSETFPTQTLQSMFDALAELPYKVVWKAVRSNFSKQLRFPDNIHFEKWMPQIDILCDPRVKLFISHGGMLSSLEAVYCGVPVLGIPLFADQTMNVAVAESRGYAIRVEYKNISKQSILYAAKTLLEHPRYRENVQKISAKFKDRPIHPLDETVYWMEYVIKHKGAPELRSTATQLWWYQYFLIDIIFAIIGALCIAFYLVYLSFKSVLIRKPYKDKTN